MIGTHNILFMKRSLRYTTSTSSYGCISFLFFNSSLDLSMPPSSLVSSASHTHASFFTRFSFLFFSFFPFPFPPFSLATMGVSYIGWSTALPPSWGGWQTTSCSQLVFFYFILFMYFYLPLLYLLILQIRFCSCTFENYKNSPHLILTSPFDIITFVSRVTLILPKLVSWALELRFTNRKFAYAPRHKLHMGNFFLYIFDIVFTSWSVNFTTPTPSDIHPNGAEHSGKHEPRGQTIGRQDNVPTLWPRGGNLHATTGRIRQEGEGEPGVSVEEELIRIEANK